MDEISRDRLNKAENLFSKKCYSEVESILKDIICKNETFGEVYILLTLSLVYLGKMSEAEETLEDAIMLDHQYFEKAGKRDDLKNIFTKIFKEEDFNKRRFRKKDKKGCQKYLKTA